MVHLVIEAKSLEDLLGTLFEMIKSNCNMSLVIIMCNVFWIPRLIGDEYKIQWDEYQSPDGVIDIGDSLGHLKNNWKPMGFH